MEKTFYTPRPFLFSCGSTGRLEVEIDERSDSVAAIDCPTDVLLLALLNTLKIQRARAEGR